MYLIVLALILSLVLTGCLLSNVGQVPTSEQSGITYLTKTFPPTGLVGWWRFNGDATDSSGNGNNGMVYGTKTYVDSPMGKALSFDGVNNYVDCGNDASLKPTIALTVEAWVNYTDFFSDSVGHAIVSESQYTSNGFMLYQACGDPYNRVRYFVRIDTGLFIGQSGTPLLINTWYHLAMTYDGSDLTLYIDGDYDSSVSATGAVKWSGTTPNLYIGSTYTAGCKKFKGLIDDVRIWNVALPQDQLGKVYEWDGFFRPIDIDNDVFNVVKAGRAIPVKFSLNGDQGLEIFDDYPKSIQVSCPGTSDSVDEMEFTETADESSLNYDAFDDQYIFVWKTNKAWAGDCRQLEVKLNDGTSHFAKFTFK